VQSLNPILIQKSLSCDCENSHRNGCEFLYESMSVCGDFPAIEPIFSALHFDKLLHFFYNCLRMNISVVTTEKSLELVVIGP